MSRNLRHVAFSGRHLCYDEDRKAPADPSDPTNAFNWRIKCYIPSFLTSTLLISSANQSVHGLGVVGYHRRYLTFPHILGPGSFVPFTNKHLVIHWNMLPSISFTMEVFALFNSQNEVISASIHGYNDTLRRSAQNQGWDETPIPHLHLSSSHQAFHP